VDCDCVVQSGDGDKRVTRDVGFGRAVVGGDPSSACSLVVQVRICLALFLSAPGVVWLGGRRRVVRTSQETGGGVSN
jgi:hypothetical protein